MTFSKFTTREQFQNIRENRLKIAKNVVIRAINKYLLNEVMTADPKMLRVMFILELEEVCKQLSRRDRKYEPVIRENWPEIKGHIINFAIDANFDIHRNGIDAILVRIR